MTAAMYTLISSDSHVIEPHDLWARHVSNAYRDRVPRLVHGDEYDTLVGEDYHYDAVGLLAGCLRSADDVRAHGRWDEDVFPGGYDPDQRIRDLDLDRVDAEILYPTIALGFYPIADAGLQWALFRAYNTWLAEFCSVSPRRLKGIAMLNHETVDEAVAELERTRALGLVGAMLPLFSGQAVTYRDPKLEPLWSRAAELGMPLHFHSSTWRDSSRSFFNVDGASDRLLNTPVQIQRVLLDLIFGGVFDRHPGLRVVSAENDAGWAPAMAERADYWWTRHRHIMGPGEMDCREPPSRYFDEHIRLTFMRERSAVLARDVIGAKALMWGNDFPHHISTWPQSAALVNSYRDDVDAGDHALMFCTNARALYGF
jgi:predicted TIM-barrel fold metal-dependent hydrolase